MSVNQKIRNLLAHGDIQKVAEKLGLTHQAVSKKISESANQDDW